MSTNTVSHVTIPASSTGVVVQTIAKAALKTFVQAALSGLLLTFSPWLLDLAATLSNGGTVTLDDLNAGGKIVAAVLIGAVASVISFGGNYFGAKTLPAGQTVQAETTP